MLRIFAGLLAAGLLVTAAPAADAAKKKKAGPDTAVLFKRLDANSDGKLTFDEFKNIQASLGTPSKKQAKANPAAAAPDLEKVFAALDTNGDKALTPEEFAGVTSRVTLAVEKKKAK